MPIFLTGDVLFVVYRARGATGRAGGAAGRADGRCSGQGGRDVQRARGEEDGSRDSVSPSQQPGKFPPPIAASP